MSRMNPWKTASMSLVVSASLGLADDFKTIDGKIYKDATISHEKGNVGRSNRGCPGFDRNGERQRPGLALFRGATAIPC